MYIIIIIIRILHKEKAAKALQSDIGQVNLNDPSIEVLLPKFMDAFPSLDSLLF